MNHSVILRRRLRSCVRKVFLTSCWVRVEPPRMYSVRPNTLSDTAATMAIGSIPGCS